MRSQFSKYLISSLTEDGHLKRMSFIIHNYKSIFGGNTLILIDNHINQNRESAL